MSATRKWPWFFDTVHRRISVPKKLLGTSSAGATASDTDADCGEELLAVQSEGLPETLYDPFGYPHRVGGILDVLDQDGELISTKAG
jgi:hypothetical protein